MEYYRMTTERAEEIAALSGYDVATVRDFCLADWPEGDEHQRWLDTAPAKEIADWIYAGGEAEAANQAREEREQAP